MIQRLLERFGYYRIDSLQHWGHCGICSTPLEGVFEKDWAVGICNKCDDSFYEEEEILNE